MQRPNGSLVDSLDSVTSIRGRRFKPLDRLTDFGRGVLLHKMLGTMQYVNLGVWKLDLKAPPLTLPKARIAVSPKNEYGLIEGELGQPPPQKGNFGSQVSP